MRAISFACRRDQTQAFIMAQGLLMHFGFLCRHTDDVPGAFAFLGHLLSLRRATTRVAPTMLRSYPSAGRPPAGRPPGSPLLCYEEVACQARSSIVGATLVVALGWGDWWSPWDGGTLALCTGVINHAPTSE